MVGSFKLLLLVHDIRVQNIEFVAPMPEHIGTTTIHFPERQEAQVKIWQGNALWWFFIVLVFNGMGATNLISIPEILQISDH